MLQQQTTMLEKIDFHRAEAAAVLDSDGGDWGGVDDSNSAGTDYNDDIDDDDDGTPAVHEEICDIDTASRSPMTTFHDLDGH